MGVAEIAAVAGDVQSACPGCHWAIVEPSWQRTPEGMCRRCGYSPATGRREPLDSDDTVLAPSAVAKICGLSRRRVYDWIAGGWLRAHRVGGRWFVTPEDLALFRATCRGALDRLMPQLWDWSEIWQAAPPQVPS